jgi:hypothetical protein
MRGNIRRHNLQKSKACTYTLHEYFDGKCFFRFGVQLFDFTKTLVLATDQ